MKDLDNLDLVFAVLSGMGAAVVSFVVLRYGIAVLLAFGY